MHLFRLYLCFALSLATPGLCYRLFDSRDPQVRSVIDQCVSETPQQSEQCYYILRCIIDNTPSEFSARWSSGASILAFIPTITALLSNSIDEVSSIADQSTLLAFLLSLSSVTAFIYRFRDKNNESSNTVFTEPTVGIDRSQAAWTNLEKMMSDIAKQRPKAWWRRSKTYHTPSCLLLFPLSAAIWYEIIQTSKYGIVTFACPIKVNLGLWAILSQLLILLNVGCRRYAFDIRTIPFRSNHPARPQPRHQATARPVPSTSSDGHARPPAPSPAKNPQRPPAPSPPTTTTGEPFTLILRSPRNTTPRWLLQTFTAVASFVLYTYGTVVLASTTLIPASDAVRVMTVVAVGAGIARLVGYGATSPSRWGDRVVVVDVPPDCMAGFYGLVLERAGGGV